jgi:predicted RNA-binding Zn ribbon-like protein
VQDFVNTLHVERGTDELASWSSARIFLRGAGYSVPQSVTQDDLDRLNALRGALRDLLTANGHGGEGHSTARAVRVLSQLAADANIAVEVGRDGTLRLRADGKGATQVVSALIVSTHDAQRDGTWKRLKVCRNGACAWAFYDYSRNHSGTWCAMGICGNRNKVARHRASQKDS